MKQTWKKIQENWNSPKLSLFLHYARQTYAPLSVPLKWRVLPPRRTNVTPFKTEHCSYSVFVVKFSLDVTRYENFTCSNLAWSSVNLPSWIINYTKTTLELHGTEKWIINMLKNAFVWTLGDDMFVLMTAFQSLQWMEFSPQLEKHVKNANRVHY